MSIDADAAVDQAADARPLMAVQIGAAARRKGDAVAAQEQRALGNGRQHGGELLMRRGARARRRPTEIGSRVMSSQRHTVAPSPPALSMIAPSPPNASSSPKIRSPSATEPCTTKIMRGSAGISIAPSLANTSSHSRRTGCMIASPWRTLAHHIFSCLYPGAPEGECRPGAPPPPSPCVRGEGWDEGAFEFAQSRGQAPSPRIAEPVIGPARGPHRASAMGCPASGRTRWQSGLSPYTGEVNTTERL
jgi:hypothetical protein